MLVTKEEKYSIEKQRLYKYFLNDPNTPLDEHNSTKYNIFKSAEKLCPSYNNGEIPPIDVLEIYLKALVKFITNKKSDLEIVLDKTLRPYFERNPIDDPNALVKTGYEITISCPFPTHKSGYFKINWPKTLKDIDEKHNDSYYLKELIKPLLSEVRTKFPKVNPLHLLLEAGVMTANTYKVEFTQGRVKLSINSQLNFHEDLVRITKTLGNQTTNKEEVLLAISKNGTISWLKIPLDEVADPLELQKQISESMGVKIDKETIFQIAKGESVKNNPNRSKFLQKSIEYTLYDRQKRNNQKFVLPYEAVIFASLSFKEIKNLAEDLMSSDYKEILEPITSRSQRILSILEFEALEKFLNINRYEKFESDEEKAKREKIQFTDIGKLENLILLSYLYSFVNPRKDVACPVLYIPEAAKVISEIGPLSYFGMNARPPVQKSLLDEIVELLNGNTLIQDKFLVFSHRVKTGDTVVFSYAFVMPGLNEYKGYTDRLDCFVLSFISKNLTLEFLERKDIKNFVFEQMQDLIMNFKQSPGLEWLQREFSRYIIPKKHLEQTDDERNPDEKSWNAWAQGMLMMFLDSLRGERPNFTYYRNRTNSIRKILERKGLLLLTQLERLQEE